MSLQAVIEQGREDPEYFNRLLDDPEAALKGEDPEVVARVKELLASRPDLTKRRLANPDTFIMEW